MNRTAKTAPVSVVIPVHDGESYLAAALESVLAQTRPVSEIIVVDDGSSDGSADIARSFDRVRVVEQAQSGAGEARNHGVREATCEWLAFLDADDLWNPSKIERQMAVFEKRPHTQVVFGHVQQFTSPELDAAERAAIRCTDDALPGYHPGTMLLARDTFIDIGWFDAGLDVGEFVDWYARAVERGIRSVMLEDVVMKRRLHSTNQGVYKKESYQRDYLRILRASLHRRRGRELSDAGGEED